MVKTFVFDVTIRVQVDIDEVKLTPLMREFNQYISDFGQGDDALVEHGNHIARLAANGIVEFHPEDFVEGYGKVRDAGIAVKIVPEAEAIYRIFPNDTGVAS